MPDAASRRGLSMSLIVLGFDFGLQKIGVAVGQELTGTAQPLYTLRAKDGHPDWNAINRIIEAWRPNALIVGEPYNMDGSEQAMTLAARRFSRRLSGRYHLPVYLVDERLSSREAHYRLRESDLIAKDRRQNIDAVAASLIVESWFEELTDSQ
jgi:putative Holliday junction resolvase